LDDDDDDDVYCRGRCSFIEQIVLLINE